VNFHEEYRYPALTPGFLLPERSAALGTPWHPVYQIDPALMTKEIEPLLMLRDEKKSMLLGILSIYYRTGKGASDG
jgi:hypothetical protein